MDQPRPPFVRRCFPSARLRSWIDGHRLAPGYVGMKFTLLMPICNRYPWGFLVNCSLAGLASLGGISIILNSPPSASFLVPSALSQEHASTKLETGFAICRE